MGFRAEYKSVAGPNRIEEDIGSVERMGRKGDLHLSVNDIPKWPSILLFGFQQTMLVLSGVLVLPYVVADIACAGNKTTELRVQLIAATFVTCGIATIVQTTFGLRLSILHGPSFAFLPPLLAYKALPENQCQYTENDDSPEEEWKNRLATLSGSLLIAVIPIALLGATGLVGKIAKYIGPITITPLLLLLQMGSFETLLDDMEEHWVSCIELAFLLILVLVLVDVQVPIPYYSFSLEKFRVSKIRLFGQFPYLIGIIFGWAVCGLLTVTNWDKPGGAARLDNNMSIEVLTQSPWFSIPLPAPFGLPQISLGLTLSYLASSMACIMESIGDYEMCAMVSCEGHPPSSSINRGILCEGFGAALAAVMGCGVGVTTYAENIALMTVTRVASRVTMQAAGCMLILLGVFTKCAAVLGTLPEPIVGGVLGVGMIMICGVALGNLYLVDLQVPRNLTIIGAAIVLGNIIPMHFTRHPINTGHGNLDEVLNMLLSIKMLVGGSIAFFLDLVVPGASKAQRGFPVCSKEEKRTACNGYALPEFINRVLRRFPWLSKLPFLPSVLPDSPISSETSSESCSHNV